MEISPETMQRVYEATIAEMGVELARKQLQIVHLRAELESSLESSEAPVSGPSEDERIDSDAI